jgi:hypothetical protein
LGYEVDLPLAFAAPSADPAIGLVLPCNVTVEMLDVAHSRVRLVDSQAMLSAAPGGLSSVLTDVPADVHARIERVVRRQPAHLLQN